MKGERKKESFLSQMNGSVMSCLGLDCMVGLCMLNSLTDQIESLSTLDWIALTHSKPEPLMGLVPYMK